MNIQTVKFPLFNEHNGRLTVFEQGSTNQKVNFPMARAFSVVANAGSTRGNHAHVRCTQLLICLSGKILLEMSDAEEKQEFLLTPNGQGMLVSPGIWVTQQYQENESVLLVLCDREYEENDYIRDHDEFLSTLKMEP